MMDDIRAPIFIVGSPRSGTSVFYNKLAANPRLAWISNITKKYPTSAFITHMLLLFRHDRHPSEGRKVWSRLNKGDDETLGAEDATPYARCFLQKIITRHQCLFHTDRFVTKSISHSVRMPFFNALFPDAYFLHVIRDGRAVAYSLMKSREKHGGRYWNIRPKGWRQLLDMPLVEACGMQWKLTVEAVLESARNLPPERYMEIRYEDFCEKPTETLQAVAAKCGLTWDTGHLAKLTADLSSKNWKWRQGLEPAAIETLNAQLGDLLIRLGYEL